MKAASLFRLHMYAAALLALLLIAACDKSGLQTREALPQADNPQRLDIGLDALLAHAEVIVTVSPRSHGYVAEARGRGTIPSGEYAGQRFQITLEGTYSGLGTETLTAGEAHVRIRSEQYVSVMDPLLQSFCCGEGHLQLVDDEYIFSMFGQVNHSTADEPHNHLFAGLASTAGFMNMNIADQTGTVVDPIDPPHDPGIGLMEGLDAMYVRVEEH